MEPAQRTASVSAPVGSKADAPKLKRKRASAVEAAAPPAVKQPTVRRRATAARSKPAREPLPAVEHPSHGKGDGDLFVFGEGGCGQLGLGEDVTEKTRPAALTIEGAKVRQSAAGGMHTVALLDDGSVQSWGVNDEGALGRQTVGELWAKAEAMREEGADKDSYSPGPVCFPATAARIVQLTAGDSHSAALSEGGSVYAWGTYRDSSGVMGFAEATRIQLVPALVYEPTCAKEQVIQIVSGADHVAALTRAGHVLTWGSGQQGMLGRVGERISHRARMSTLLSPQQVPFKRRRGAAVKITDVAAGTYSTFARTADGEVYSWGLNNYGQLGLLGQGLVFAPTLVAALSGKGVLEVVAGQHHTLAITKGGGLLSWGRPTYGRLGRQGVDVKADSALPEPLPVGGLEGVRVLAASAGLAASGAVDGDGRAWLWGFGTNSQLGKGDDDTDEVLPAKLKETTRLKGQRSVGLHIGGQHVLLRTLPGETSARAGAA